MKALLDTHALLWFALNDTRLSPDALSVIVDRDNELLVSPATLWEIAIKVSLNKYVLQEEFTTFFAQQMLENDLTLLPITLAHVAAVVELPFHHRDPFDRLLAAQALTERLSVVSIDRAFDLYSVPRIW